MMVKGLYSESTPVTMLISNLIKLFVFICEVVLGHLMCVMDTTVVRKFCNYLWQPYMF